MSENKVKDLTKIQILKLLEDRQAEVDKELMASNARTIYMIIHLTNEYVDPVDKKKLERLAAIKVKEFYDNIEATELQDKSALVKKWRRKYLRSARLSIRKEQISRYLENPDEYILPRKQ